MRNITKKNRFIDLYKVFFEHQAFRIESDYIYKSNPINFTFLLNTISWFGIIVLLSFSSYSQGGDNYATASASPITLPFTSSGTTIGATNNYTNLSGGLYWYTTGQDWGYYFCATTSGPINIFLGNANPGFSSNYIRNSVSVWTGGAPGAGGVLVASVTDDLSVPTPPSTFYGEEVLIFDAVAGQCYFVLVDYSAGTYGINNGFNYNLTIQEVPEPVLQPSCTNIGYESGSTSGWQGTYGHTVKIGDSPTESPDYSPSYYGFNGIDFLVTSGAAIDPYGGFSTVCPGFGTNSLRIGDLNNVAPNYTRANNGGASAEQQFSVTASNALFTYQYAVVIQDGGSNHAINQQPFFKVQVLDCDGNEVVCGQYLVTGGPDVPGFSLAPGTTDVYYKQWTPVMLDLTAYIGSCVTVRYTVADCSQGAHFAYAYVDAICAPMEITGPTNVCPNNPFSLTAPIGGNSYEWTVVGSSTVIGTDQVLTTTQTLNTVNYQCEITTVTGCVTILTFEASLFPPVQVSTTSVTICAGTSGSLIASGNPLGGDYFWSPGGATTAIITVNPTVTTNYTCTYTDINECTATESGTITVIVIPPVPVVTPVSYCLNEVAVPLVATASAGCSLNWYTVSTGGIATTSSPIPNTNTAGVTTYYVSQTSAFGCEGPRSPLIVTINSLPTVAVNSPTICSSETAVLTATGAISYLWNGVVAPSPFSVTPLSTTTYMLIGEDVNGCSDTVVATVTVLTNLTMTVNSPIICSGESVVLTANGASSYSWSNGASLSSITVSPTVTTSYVVTGFSNGCTGVETAIVTINPLPVPPSVIPVAYCQNESALQLVATASSGCVLNWYGLSSSGGIPSLVSPVPNTSVVGTADYYVSQTDFLTGCEGPMSVITVTVNPLPAPPAVTPITYCQYDVSVPLTAVQQPGFILKWYVDLVSPTLLSSAPTPNTSITGLFIFYVSQYNVSTGCESSIVPLEVIINPLPPSPTVNSVVYCQNDVALPLYASLDDPNYELKWYTISVGGVASVNPPTPSTSVEGLFTYYVSALNTLTGCESPRVSLNVTVNAPVVPLFSTINSLCEGSVEPILPIVSMDEIPISGSWNMPVNMSLIGTTTYIFTPSIGQCAIPTSLDVTLIPMPILIITNPDEVCEPGTVDITEPSVTFGSTGVLAYWQDAAGTIPLISPASIDESGVYFIESSLQGCSIILPVTVVINPLPIADFVPVPSEVSSLNPYSVMENNSIGAISYVWNFDDNETSTLINPGHYFEGNESGQYQIVLTATNEFGCVDIASATLVVIEELLFYVPNTFTPDRDNYNEVFLPVFTSGFDPYVYVFYIYNRWGELIFESHDASVGWKGTYGPDQIQVQDGTYTWKIHYKLINSNLEKVVVGHVNVLR